MAAREPLATIPEVSKYTGLAAQTLQNMRSQGRGPAWQKLGNRVRYRWSDVDKWLAGQTVKTAS